MNGEIKVMPINNDLDHKKQLWLEFRLNNHLLMSYTVFGTFEGELEATLESLSYDNDCEISDIKVKRIYK